MSSIIRDNSAPVIRIALRYAGGALAAHGWIAQGDTGIFDDPDLVAVLSLALAALCSIVGEVWYVIARRFEWSK